MKPTPLAITSFVLFSLATLWSPADGAEPPKVLYLDKNRTLQEPEPPKIALEYIKNVFELLGPQGEGRATEANRRQTVDLTGRNQGMKLTRWLRNIHIAVAILGSLLCLDRVPAAESRPDERPGLRMPLTDSKPVVDGKLEEPCWKDAVRTGRLTLTQRGKNDEPE